jgi:phage gpG-like protein
MSFSIENDTEFKNHLENALDQVQDLRFAFGEISRDFFKSNKAVFTLKNGGQYPPLSREYEERKRKILGRIEPILVFSGRLRDSLTGNPNSDSIVRIGKASLILGTSVSYGYYHQADAPRSKIPQRKFLFIDDARKTRWMRIIDDEVARKLKAIS